MTSAFLLVIHIVGGVSHQVTCLHCFLHFLNPFYHKGFEKSSTNQRKIVVSHIVLAVSGTALPANVREDVFGAALPKAYYDTYGRLGLVPTDMGILNKGADTKLVKVTLHHLPPPNSSRQPSAPSYHQASEPDRRPFR